MFDGLAGSFGVAATLATFVIGAFWKYEDVASPEAKLKVTHWLRYSGPTTGDPGWADHLVVAFNKIFGERHFSFKCFWRSCLASTFAVLIMYFVWAFARPNEFKSYAESVERAVDKLREPAETLGVIPVLIILFLVTAMAMIVISWIPNYFSYLKTRVILARIRKAQGVAAVLAFALLDLALTVAIYIITSAFIFIPLILLGETTLTEFLYSLWTDLYLSEPEEGAPGGILFYAALFVSAWSWLYALTALSTRFMVRLFPKLLTSTVWFFDVDGHPLRSLGCIAGGIVFIGVLAREAWI